MSLTPERRVTPPSVQGLSVHSILNAGPAQQSMDVPSFRVEAAAERSTSSMSTQSQASLASTKGNLLDGVYSPLATFLVKIGVGTMVLFSLVIMWLGEDSVTHLSQFFGFGLIFTVVFAVSCGGYLWWISWVHEAVKLDVHSTLMMLLACVCSELISMVANQMLDVGQLGLNLSGNLSFYAVHTASLFCLFPSLVHQKGKSAVFAHETSIFVCLTVVMHYTTASIFSNVLPSFMYGWLAYGSCFLAMCVSLVLLRHQPSISLVGLRRLIRTSIHSKTQSILPPSYAGRRYSNVSMMSTVSSIRPKNSITDQSSVSVGYQDMIDADNLAEANGMIGDLLFQEERLTQKGRESLKKIQELLTFKFPSSSVQYIPRSRLGSTDSDTSNISTVRKVSFSQKRNQSSQFTTTTTSTGLPNVEKDPMERKRSQASRDRARLSVVDRTSGPGAARLSIHRMSSPLISKQYKKSLPSLSPSSSSLRVSTDSTDGTASASDLDAASGKSEGSAGEEDRGTLIRRMVSRSESLDVITEDDEKRTPTAANAPSMPPSDKKRLSSETDTDVFSRVPKLSKASVLTKIPLCFNEYTEPPPVSVEFYEDNRIDVLDQVCDWDFPIFDLERLSNGNILSQMAFCVFKEAGLMETYNIPYLQFLNYFRALEANYGANTYHNRTHAADVLHATSYLLFEEIPEFSYDPISESLVDDGARQWIGNLRSKSAAGNIASAFTILEVFACYMAAAMHDFDHPGRTNAFLVATRNPLAVLYNDRSVLENHHAAASWDLLFSNTDKNFLINLDSTELKRLRFLIIECILATDLKQHFEIVRDFREKFDPETSGGIDWGSDVDRLQVMKMIIKMADINTPTKSLELHRSWTVRITEEFYQQHEDEMRLDLPQTIFMDRHEKEKLPAIQVSFIQNLVAPLFRACAEVGIIPGIVESVGSKDDGLSDGEISSDDVLADDYDDSIPDDHSALIRPTKNIFSVILTNLQMNFEAWKDELPKENEEESADATATTDDEN